MANITKLQSLYVCKEDSYGADPSASGASYTYVHAEDMDLTLDREVLERPMQGTAFTREPHVMGSPSWTLSFKLDARGSGTPTVGVSGTVAIAPQPDAIFETVFGAVDKDNGDLTAADCTVSLIKVSTGTRFSVGNLIAVDVSSTYGIQARRITAISTNDISVSPNLSAAPAATRQVYAGANYRMSTTGHPSLALVVKGNGREFLLLGGRGSVTFDGFTAGKRPRFACSFRGDSWTDNTSAAKASLPAETDALTNYAPPVVGSPLYYGGSAVVVSEFGFDYGASQVDQASTAATTGRADLVVVDTAPKGAFKPYWTAAHLADFSAGTERELLFQLGTTAGNIVAIAIPKAQITSFKLPDKDGLLGEELAFAANASDVTNVPNVTMTIF